MKRRSFLGLFGGAVVGGPKLAKSLAESGAISSMTASPTAGASNAVGSVDGKWEITRIAQLREILSGTSKEEAQQRRANRMYAAESVERFRLDSLRSVSPCHRMQMFIDSGQQRQQRINRMNAEAELEHLLTPKLPF